MRKLNVEIPTDVGVIVLLVLSFFTAWFVISVGEKIINTMPYSKLYDGQKATQELITNKKR